MGRFLERLLGLLEPVAVRFAFGNMIPAHEVKLLPIGPDASLVSASVREYAGETGCEHPGKMRRVTRA